MHDNRINFSLPEYQRVLISRWQRTVFWFAKKGSASYDMYFAKPTPRTQWLDGKPRSKYYRRLFARLYDRLRDSKKKYSFCTLTYHTLKYSQKYAFLLLKDHLKEFIRLIRKKYPKLQYYWVIELTKRLYPHIHIVFDCYVHWLVIRAIWYRITKSYIIHIKSIPAAEISRYLTSYLTKQKKQNKIQWNCIYKNIDRLYGCSKYFFDKVPISPKEREWFLISLTTDCFLQDWQLFREDNEKDFWLIPHHYAASLLFSHYIDHINWNDDYPDIYSSFLDSYSREELRDLTDSIKYYQRSFNPDNVIPF